MSTYLTLWCFPSYILGRSFALDPLQQTARMYSFMVASAAAEGGFLHDFQADSAFASRTGVFEVGDAGLDVFYSHFINLLHGWGFYLSWFDRNNDGYTIYDTLMQYTL